MFRGWSLRKLSSFQIVILGFVGVILTGALLLTLPFCSASGRWTGFEEALFTATSAVCVTGLVVVDTALHWSRIGQAVILLLIQIGGLGVVAVTVGIATFSGRKISLLQRRMMQDSISAHQVGGVVKLTGFILRTVLIIELLGALLLLRPFVAAFGAEGVWMAAFHSVSAFCNAGFDLMGAKSGAFSSLTAFQSSWSVVLPICLLILVGGIGFLTWDDVSAHRFHMKKYRMQSKAVLVVSAVLIAGPTLAFFLGDFAALPLSERLSSALFQAVTPRTAGFNTVDLSAMSGAGQAVIIMLMLVGGAPGSTAGGMKMTTVAVLFANAAAVFHRKKNARLFGRRIEDGVVKTAATLFVMYVLIMALGAVLISMAEGLPMGKCLFETASAIATVGLSLGITPSLGTLSRIVLVVMMFLGRVGGLTLMFAALSNQEADVSQSPVERISVG